MSTSRRLLFSSRTTPCRAAPSSRSLQTRSLCASIPFSVRSTRSSGSAASLLKVIEQKPIAEIDDQTLILADVGRKAIAQVKQAAARLLQRRLKAEDAEALAEKLSTGTWTHDYPIFASIAKELGLSVNTDMPNEVLELMKLYPQPVRAQSGGGVEYLPVPRRKEAAER